MRKYLFGCAMAAVLAAAADGPAFAQGAREGAQGGKEEGGTATVAITRVETVAVADTRRASEVIDAEVVNARDETVGTVDDLLIGMQGDQKMLFAVLSVGGFLGLGERYVVVPYDDLSIKGGAVVLAGATKASLEGLPEFNYPQPRDGAGGGRGG